MEPVYEEKRKRPENDHEDTSRSSKTAQNGEPDRKARGSSSSASSSRKFDSKSRKWYLSFMFMPELICVKNKLQRHQIRTYYSTYVIKVHRDTNAEFNTYIQPYTSN